MCDPWQNVLELLPFPSSFCQMMCLLTKKTCLKHVLQTPLAKCKSNCSLKVGMHGPPSPSSPGKTITHEGWSSILLVMDLIMVCPTVRVFALPNVRLCVWGGVLYFQLHLFNLNIQFVLFLMRNIICGKKVFAEEGIEKRITSESQGVVLFEVEAVGKKSNSGEKID